jgi:hypothetical protein
MITKPAVLTCQWQTVLFGTLIVFLVAEAWTPGGQTQSARDKFVRASQSNGWKIAYSQGVFALAPTVLDPASGKPTPILSEAAWVRIREIGYESLLMVSLSPDARMAALTIIAQGKPIVALVEPGKDDVQLIPTDALIFPGIDPTVGLAGTQNIGVRELYLSPDKSKLAYMIVMSEKVNVGRGSHGYFCVYDSQTNMSHLISELDGTQISKWFFLGYPWAPDSDSLIYPAAGDKLGIFRLSTKAKEIVPAEGSSASWRQTEGGSFAYLGANGIYSLVDITTGERTLTCQLNNPESIRHIVLSPDGNFAIFVRDIRGHRTLATDPKYEIGVVDIGRCEADVLLRVSSMVPFISIGGSTR